MPFDVIPADRRERPVDPTAPEEGRRRGESGRRRAESGRRRATTGRSWVTNGVHRASTAFRRAVSGRRGAEPRTLRRRSRRLLVEAGVLLVIVALVGIGAVIWARAEISRNIDTLGDPFAALPDRPPEAAVPADEPAAVNILFVGSDRRTPGSDPARVQDNDEPHADSVMLVHLPGDRQRAYVMSFPRDSMVRVPDEGRAKISTIFASGGAGLIVHTVEELTGARVDHLAVANFESFARITDHLGGVTIDIPTTTYDSSRGETIPAGTYRMDGADALGYVRQRHGLPNGELDRVQRQQNWLRSISDEILSDGVRDNPLELVRVLRILSESLAVDDSLSVDRMRELALSARSVGEGEMIFFTAPVASRTPTGNDQSIVELDADRLAAVSEALAEDEMSQFFTDHPDYLVTLGDRVD